MDQLSPVTRPNVPIDPDASRWDAVCRRDASADGRFVYSVMSTGVYCRPGCPARLPLRRNVAFHATAGEAERAGFRPCERCRPNEPSQAERHGEAVADACGRIDAAIERGDAVPTLAALARGAGMSVFHFHRVFQAVAGVTPRGYAAALRAERLRESLPGGGSVTEAGYDAGYSSSGRLYEGAASRLGMRPSAYRDGGAGAAIRFAVGECSLGSVLVAATEQGVCAIAFGDDPEALVKDLQDRFPKAALIGADGRFEAWVAAVDRGRRGNRRRASTCRSTCAAPSSRPRCGGRCARSLPARRRATPPSPSGSAGRARCGRWRKPAPKIPSRSRSPATAWCAATARPAATAGASSASASFWAARRAASPSEKRHERRRREDPRRRRAPAASAVGERVAALAWDRIGADLDAYGCAVTGPLLTAGECAGLAALYGTRRGLPQPDRHGPARVRARRVQVLRRAAAGPGGGLCGPHSIRASPRSRIAGPSSWASPSASRTSTRRSWSAATPPGRPGRPRCCCATRPATTTACTRTSTAPTSSRSRSRSCSPSPAAISRAASSC